MSMTELFPTPTDEDVLQYGASNDGGWPEITITGPTIDVSATTNYTADTISNVTGITFEGSASLHATFLASQFAAGQIATNTTITGNTNSDVVDVDVKSGQTFSGASLKFASWSSSDTVEAIAQGDHVHLTGTSGSDEFSMGSYFDSSDVINGGAGSNMMTLSGNYSSELGVTSSMLQNIDEIVFANNNYDLQFYTGVVPTGHVMVLDGAPVAGTNELELDVSNDTSGRYDIFLGTTSDNRITLNDAVDTVVGAAAVGAVTGQDFVYTGGVIPTTDKIEGNGSTMNFYLDGNYSAGYTFGASEATEISELYVASGFSYNLTVNNGIVEAGKSLGVYAYELSAGNSFTFNGSAETAGSFQIFAAPGVNHLTGGSLNDAFVFEGGSMFTTSDTINGGGGSNYISLDGNYSAGLTITSTMVQNIDEIDASSGFNYKLTLDNGVVASGKQMEIISNSTLTETMNFNGSALTTGNLELWGGAGADTFVGGGGTNTFVLNGASYTMTCGSATNIFQVGAVANSTGPTFATIVDFNPEKDQFDLFASKIDPTVTTGTLSASTFNANLEAAIGAGQLGATDAVLFTPNAGTYAGDTFLIVDENGVAGYQAGADYVFELKSPVDLSHLSTSNFVG